MPDCQCHSRSFLTVNERLHRSFSRRAFASGAAATVAVAAWPAAARAAIPEAPEGPIVFTNVRVFDGISPTVRDGMRVVVNGGTISAIEPAAGAPPAGAALFDAGGMTLMPGMIDAHCHIMLSSLSMNVLLTADPFFIAVAAAEEARRTLMRGFTSIRDMAGPSLGLKAAIDAGLTPGPRIWPSGAMISQSGGHGDFRFPYEVPSPFDAGLSHAEKNGVGAIADGHDQVLKRAREQLQLGASQVKLAAGGGVASAYDPIDVSQYTLDEFRAAVEAAENWGTYVAVHAYTSRAIQTALRAGVMSIEHGQLMDEATAEMIGAKGAWLSSQAFIDNQYQNQYSDPAKAAKKRVVYEGTDRTYGFARKYKLKTAWGTDVLFDAKSAANQAAILTTMTRWYSHPEILTMATATNAELLARSGPRNPYPGKLGVVKTGALADLLLLNGDPTRNVDLVADADSIALIMKDGRIYKNTLRSKT